MTRSDLLTFFSVPGGGEPTIRMFTLRLPDAPEVEIWIYSHKKLDLSEAARATVATDADYKNLVQSLQAALSKGGGLIAELQPHNGFTRVALTPIKAEGFQPPQQALRLGPAEPAKFEAMLGTSQDSKLGDHIVVPTTADAEGRLRAFCEELKGFPPDLESSLLNVIRRPSLEWRIERIERSLSLPPATWARQQASQSRGETPWERVYRSIMWKIPIGPAVAAMLLLSVGSVWAFSRIAGKSEAQVATAEEVSSGTASAVPVPTPAALSQQEEKPSEGEELEEPLSDLRTALESSEKSEIQTLYKTHLKEHWNKGNSSDPFFWGLAKLQALRLQLSGVDDEMLRSANAQTRVKVVYDQESNRKKLEEDEAALNVLLWSCCERSPRPELPATQGDPKPLPLPTTATCGQVRDGDVAAGLTELAEWIRKG